MNGSGENFRVRPGRIRSTRAGKSKSFVNQVLRAAKRAGHTAPQSGPGKPTGLGRSTFGRGRFAFSHNRLFSATRRVVVKARVARHQGRAFRSAPVSAHVAYLNREGVTRDGEKARMFDADTDRADDAGFAESSREDRHHFRFIVSPEDAAEMTDLKAFTRDLARQMEADLGTRLDWIASPASNNLIAEAASAPCTSRIAVLPVSRSSAPIMLRRSRPAVCATAGVSSGGAQQPTARAPYKGCTASAKSTTSSGLSEFSSFS